jgi:multidrug resistance efflux pump
MASRNSILTWLVAQPKWRFAAVLLLIAGGVLYFRGTGKAPGNGLTFAARRGPLDISVLEGGSIQALESQEIKCEVRVGYQGTKILKIVEEGYQVTDEDVKTNKMLVELDPSELEKQILQQEIAYQSAAASFTEAQQGYEIQVNQNASDIMAAEQKARFARMDFEKFLGAEAAQQVIQEVAARTPPEPTNSSAALLMPEAKPSAQPPAQATAPGATNAPTAPAAPAAATVVAASPQASSAPTLVTIVEGGPPLASVTAPPPAVTPPAPEPAPPPPKVEVDFLKYAKVEVLGDGDAKQKLRKFEDDLQLAKKELGQAQSQYEGTKRLFDKGFVTKVDLQREEIAFENNRLKVQTAETARDLFLKYEFVKLAEESLSKYTEAARELNRARKAAVSKLAQAEARLKSAQGQYNVQLRQRKELQEQLAKCLIRATKPGLVVYGSARDEYYWGGEERIREGATVRERQTMITIPDLTKMSARVKIPESYIKKVKKGQKAKITVETAPDQKLTGEVTKVGVLPDSENRWMNPDMKVYLTTVTVDGLHDWLKPGMSAKIEIMVDRLDDVVYVPIQAITPIEGKRVCYVLNGKPEPREVEVGQFNDEFIEIKKGMKEGEKVLLRPPEGAQPQQEKEPKQQPKPVVPPGGPAAGPVGQG